MRRLAAFSTPQGTRQLSRILLVVAGCLTIWIFFLGSDLHGQAQVRNWSSTWVGLDLMEIVGLLATAVLIRRRSVYLAPVAAVTATMFGLDAWFDVMTASAGFDYLSSLGDAFFAEIPMTGLLAATSIWSARSARGQRPVQELSSMPSSTGNATETYPLAGSRT